jgi:hypothetical protein
MPTYIVACTLVRFKDAFLSVACETAQPIDTQDWERLHTALNTKRSGLILMPGPLGGRHAIKCFASALTNRRATGAELLGEVTTFLGHNGFEITVTREISDRMQRVLDSL